MFIRNVCYALGLFSLTACGDGWGEPMSIDSQVVDPPRFPYFGPRIAAGPSGDAALIYTHQDRELRASRGDTTWSAPARISAHSGRSDHHAIAVASDGTAMAVFNGPDGLAWSRNVAGVWSSPVSFGVPTAARPRLVAGGAGKLLAAWVTSDDRAWAAVWDGGWGAASELGSVTGFSLRLAMSAAGDAIAAWCQTRGGGAEVVANRFSGGKGWSGPEPLATLPECATPVFGWDFLPAPSTVDVGIATTGVPTVLWTDGNIKFRRWAPTPVSDWIPEVALTTRGDAVNPQLAVNASGDALAAWQTTTVRSEVVEALAYSTRTGRWSPTATIAGDGRRPPQLAVGIDQSARGFVVYQQGSTFAARFNSESFLAPEDVGLRADYEFSLAVSPSGTAYLARGNAQRDLFVTRYDP